MWAGLAWASGAHVRVGWNTAVSELRNSLGAGSLVVPHMGHTDAKGAAPKRVRVADSRLGALVLGAIPVGTCSIVAEVYSHSPPSARIYLNILLPLSRSILTTSFFFQICQRTRLIPRLQYHNPCLNSATRPTKPAPKPQRDLIFFFSACEFLSSCLLAELPYTSQYSWINFEFFS